MLTIYINIPMNYLLVDGTIICAVYSYRLSLAILNRQEGAVVGVFGKIN